MTAAERKRRLDALGYGLERNVKDAFGKSWQYKTFPVRSGGPTNYFHDVAAIEKYIQGVEKIRAWQAEPLPE